MDKNTIEKISRIIDDRLNGRINLADAKRKINGILHNKTVTVAITELHDYVISINGKDKNVATLIVIMALLRRNLDDILEVKEAIIHHGLTGHLYGGLYTLLTGQSEHISLKVNLNDSVFENKYAFITRFVEFNYWEYIEIFQAAKILSMADPQKFERLALADNTKLLLLNMASYNLDIIPSNELIHKLIENNDDLYQNLGFDFLTRSISRCVSDYDNIQKSKKHDSNSGKKIRNVHKEMKKELKVCDRFLSKCKKRTQASLLMNYLLVHQNAYPTSFARALLNSDLQEEFIYQINQTGKIKTLKDVSFIITLISNTPATNSLKRRISKNKLYEAIITVVMSFIEERKGIYSWDVQKSNYIKNICQRLPLCYIKKLKIFLSKEDAKLMSNKLDELVRFDIFLKDKRQHDIIFGIISAIDSLNTN